MSQSESGAYPFDIAISYAGEDRAIANHLFELLQVRNISAFYDINEQANMWGKDLIEHLTDVYENKARYCLILISKNYPTKPWTQVERRSAQARAFRQPGEYILPVRLDDTEIPGLLSTIAYLDLRHQSVEEIADQVVKKLGQFGSQSQQKTAAVPSSGVAKYKIPLPQVTRSYTELDKDRFVENAFEVMKDYFRQALSDLKRHYPETETDMKEINTVKFFARIYVQGHLQCMCKIWLGNSSGAQSIYYLEDARIDINNDNSYNDYLSVDQTNSGLGLRISGFAIGMGAIKPEKEVVFPEEAAEYLWRRFTFRLKNV